MKQVVVETELLGEFQVPGAPVVEFPGEDHRFNGVRRAQSVVLGARGVEVLDEARLSEAPLNIPVVVSPNLVEVIRRNEPERAEVGDYLVWQFVTRGPGARAREGGPPTVCVRVAPVTFNTFASYYETGVHGVISRTRSYPPQSIDPKVKHWSRVNFGMADLEAADVDPESWPILTDLEGNLTEGTVNNVFLVTNGTIRTSTDRSILQGVSRGMVFDLAHQLNIPVAEEDLQPYDLYTADEAFYASSGPCVLPMTRADMRQVGDGKPGPITQQLLAAWSEAVDVDIVGQALRFGT